MKTLGDMRTIKILFIAVVLLVSGSCMFPEKVVFRSYVRRYYSAKEIELEFSTKVIDNKVIVIKPFLASTVSRPPFLCSYESDGDKQILYDELCLKHNDMSYNRTIFININDPVDRRYDYIGTDFISISVVSDSDFDAEHAAGSELGDVIRYASYSPKKYIDSGYTEEFDWVYSEGLARAVYASDALAHGVPTALEHPAEKLVSELTPADLTLLSTKSLGAMQFERLPTLSQTHRLTVTMTTDDGTELSASIDMDF